MKIPSMRKYTPKALGMTAGKHGSYYGACPEDSFDPVQSFKACVEGKATTKFKKTVTKAVMDKYSSRDERMYTTIDLRDNIALENTKDHRAEDIR